MRTSTKLVRLAPGALAAVTAAFLYANGAVAQTFDDGVTTVGTDYQREPGEMGCVGTCHFDAHFPLTTCSKTASERLRFQRDALPDETVRSKSGYTTCNNYYWDNFQSVDSHAHHQDAKVTSGTGKVHFFYTEIH